MAKNLILDNSIGTAVQPVKDQDGKSCALSLSADKVGIGTTTPNAKLNVDPKGPGGILIGDTNIGFTSLNMDISAAKDGFARIESIQTSGSVWGNLALNPSGGNVGVGTTEPNAKLHVDPKGAGGILIGDPHIGFTSLRMDVSAAQNGFARIEAVQTSGSVWGNLALNPNGGNVGIGTATPSAKLEVNGDIVATGDIRLLNADCAEDFDICATDLAEPGTVMVLGEDGKLEQSQKAYDKRVAGVISGAGDYKPGIVLDKQETGHIRKPVALLGKVFCKVDASYGAIEVGDLLTTSPTPGHAMKVDDPLQAFGTVIGKALRPLAERQGLIPILIALQ